MNYKSLIDSWGCVAIVNQSRGKIIKLVILDSFCPVEVTHFKQTTVKIL